MDVAGNEYQTPPPSMGIENSPQGDAGEVVGFELRMAALSSRIAERHEQHTPSTAAAWSNQERSGKGQGGV